MEINNRDDISSTNLKTGRMKIDVRFEDETVWLS